MTRFEYEKLAEDYPALVPPWNELDPWFFSERLAGGDYHRKGGGDEAFHGYHRLLHLDL